MKVRKEISLTPETYAIAARMANFSQWVRIGLRAYDMKEDLATEKRRRIRYAHAARHLASALREYALLVDESFDKSVDELIAKAMNQTTLEEFE